MLAHSPWRARGTRVVLAALAGIVPCDSSGAQAPAVVPVAVVDVTVIPMTRDGPRSLAHQTVLVRDGKIAEVGPTARVRVPSDAQRIDGRGKYLIPGLAEMHGHIPQQAGPFAERTLLLFVANGVTTVRGMLGAPYHLELRDAIRKGEMLGPTLVLAGPMMSGNQVTSPDDAARRVREYKSAGYDLLKVHEGLTPEVYDAIASTAKAVGIPWGGHVSDPVGLPHALTAGQSTIDHLDNYVEALNAGAFGNGSEDERIAAMVKATKDAGAAVVPTMALWEVFLAPEDSASLASRSELRYMPPQMVQQWFAAAKNFRANAPAEGPAEVALRKKILGALHRGGVPVLLGTDAPQLFSVPGFSLAREMRIMVESGMTPYDVLVSGTRNVADYFATYMHMPREAGTIEAGKRADMILVDADPTASVDNIWRQSGVILRGKWLEKSDLNKRLEASLGN